MCQEVERGEEDVDDNEDEAVLEARISRVDFGEHLGVVEEDRSDNDEDLAPGVYLRGRRTQEEKEREEGEEAEKHAQKKAKKHARKKAEKQARKEAKAVAKREAEKAARKEAQEKAEQAAKREAEGAR